MRFTLQADLIVEILAQESAVLRRSYIENLVIFVLFSACIDPNDSEGKLMKNACDIVLENKLEDKLLYHVRLILLDAGLKKEAKSVRDESDAIDKAEASASSINSQPVRVSKNFRGVGIDIEESDAASTSIKSQSVSRAKKIPAVKTNSKFSVDDILSDDAKEKTSSCGSDRSRIQTDEGSKALKGLKGLVDAIDMPSTSAVYSPSVAAANTLKKNKHVKHQMAVEQVADKKKTKNETIQNKAPDNDDSDKKKGKNK
uniref:Uncharacterized protein n=1 Tax=Ditylenchus dipsaci TaxID=166011 RepID=A0A915D1B6_9BILA